MRLFGRSNEVDVLGSALDDVVAHRPSVVVLEGEAGVGKSRLLAHAEDEARRRRIGVFVGRGEELEASRPFGLMVRLLSCAASSTDPRRAHIAALLTSEDRSHAPVTVSSDPGLQFRVIDEMVDLIEQSALSEPTLLGVDDLQWADPSSLLTLATLVRRVASLPVALVACARPVPRSPELARVMSMFIDAGAHRVDVRGLDLDGVQALVNDWLAAAPGPNLMQAVEKAAGNPLFITELLGAFDEDKAMQIVDGRAEISESGLSPILRLTILRRLGFLSDAALGALRAASILGSGFTLADLSVTTAQSAIDLASPVAETLSARVLEEDGDRLRFRHDLIRDAVYDDMPISVRRGLHREAGQRLAGAGAPLQQIAEQLSRGATQGDAEAIRWLTTAGRAATDRSPEVSVALLQRALELTDPTDPRRDQMRLEVATCQMFAGQGVDAVDGCRALLDIGHDAAVRASARVCLGHAPLAAGQPYAALEELRQAGSGGYLPAADAADADAWAGLASLFVGDLEGAAALADRARTTALAAGNSVAVSVAINVRACICQVVTDLRGALEAVDEAIRLADASPGRAGHRYPLYLSRGHVLIDLDEVDEARRSLDLGRRACEEFGVRWPLASHQTLGGLQSFITGDWDDANVAFEASFELAGETGERQGAIISRAVVALICLHRNDLRGAHDAATCAVADLDAAGGGMFRGQWARWALALVLEAQGDRDAAFVALARCWDDCRAGRLLHEYPIIGADLVRLALAVGDADRAQEVCAAVADVAARNDVPSLGAVALRCRGLTDHDIDALEAAADAFARGPRVLDTALTIEDAGVAHCRGGDQARGRALLDDAAHRFEQLDAARDLLRVEAALRAAGVRRGQRGPRAKARHGWASLTPTEHTVARLAADGLSNPQIGDQLYVSHRTVQTHLSHIFTKLGISSRVQLTVEVTRRDDAAH